MISESLLRQARDGDPGAEELLFQYLSDRIRYSVDRRVGNLEDAEEIVQDALMTVLREYRQVEITTSFAAWVFKIVDFKILSYRRDKRRTRERHVYVNGEDQLPANSDPDPDFKRRLLDCLKHLGEFRNRHARALILHAHGFGVEEICDRMKITRNALYLLLSRSRARLATCLDKGTQKS